MSTTPTKRRNMKRHSRRKRTHSLNSSKSQQIAISPSFHIGSTTSLGWSPYRRASSHRRLRNNSRSNNFNKKRQKNSKKRDNKAVLDNKPDKVPDVDADADANITYLCNNPNTCTSFDAKGDVLKSMFHQYRAYDMIDSVSVKRIGKFSMNGYVIEIPFVYRGPDPLTKPLPIPYRAHTVLKCTFDEDSDNLYYEYCVGKWFINKWIRKVPCFVETYDLYEFQTADMRDKFEQRMRCGSYDPEWKRIAHAKQNPNAPPLPKSLPPIEPFKGERFQDYFRLIQIDDPMDPKAIAKSCTDFRNLCIMIQHFGDVKTFHNAFAGDVFEPTYADPDIKWFAWGAAYQILFALCMLGDTYTHYDLHSENILGYKPFQGDETIWLRYHLKNGQKVEMRAERVFKIIDYGRNYVNNSALHTPGFVTAMSSLPECPNKGWDMGYSVVSGEDGGPGSFDYVDPIRPNQSHDLWFLSDWDDMFTSVNPSAKITFLNDRGTPEDLTGNDTNDIRSIYDAKAFLERILTSTDYSNQQPMLDIKWPKANIAATMDIYEDGRDYVYRKGYHHA